MSFTLKTNLTSFVRATPAQASGQDGELVEVDLDDVPMLGIETRPLRGVSTYFGLNDPPKALREQILAAEAAGDALYEVRLHVAYESPQLKGISTPTVADIQRGSMLNLPRATVEATDWLTDMIRDEIAAIPDRTIADWRLPKVISRYPHLLDALASTEALRHIALILWQTDVPGVRAAKVATVYNPDCVREVHTINSDHVRAVLPARLYEGLDHHAGIVIQRQPGMG